ncbi:hypothetical protein B7P43_G06201 [Cryptotermes secundus]|uniref:Uncharacterized protein n=1 Tax=Cryptotermes secundus TaxID=105785 RepID=A0A2J7RAN8_9NEOP|nr:hypothetical protein B7P43_G06201 [Cryptotermes secundus]
MEAAYISETLTASATFTRCNQTKPEFPANVRIKGENKELEMKTNEELSREVWREITWEERLKEMLNVIRKRLHGSQSAPLQWNVKHISWID